MSGRVLRSSVAIFSFTDYSSCGMSSVVMLGYTVPAIFVYYLSSMYYCISWLWSSVLSMRSCKSIRALSSLSMDDVCWARVLGVVGCGC